VQVTIGPSSAQELADSAAADLEEESPTRRIPRVQVTTGPSSAQELADSAAADLEEESPTRRIPRVQVTTQPSSAQEVADSAAADPEEESPTRRIPRVQVTTGPSSAQELADSAAADPNVAGTENVHEEKVDPAASRQELSSQGLPRSLVDMELMIASIRSTTREVDAEKADAVAAESEEVDAEKADAVAADSEEVDAEKADAVAVDSEEVDAEKADAVAADSEEVDAEKADAVAAESEEVDGEKADAVAADSEKTDATLTSPDDPDIVQMPAVGAVLSGGRQPPPQLPEEQVLGPVPIQGPADKKRFRSLALAAALAALLIGAFFFANRDVGGVTAQSDATVTATATMPVSKPSSVRSAESTDTGRDESTIQLEALSGSASPMEAVRIQGRYRGGARTFLRVQRWEGGKWLDFPVPTKTDRSGQFTTYVELGQPGRYTLRVLDPDSGVASKPFVLVIDG
jgi:hypothetical protein